MHTRITIYGYVVGAIWWPTGAECFKHFSYDLTREQARMDGAGLRDHILAICRDGDFQSCSIAAGQLEIEMSEQTTKGRRTVRRVFDLSQFPSIADCLHPDPDWCPQFDDESEAA